MRVDITDFADLSDHDEDPDIAELALALKSLKKTSDAQIGYEREERERRKSIKQALFGKFHKQVPGTLENLLSQDCFKGTKNGHIPQDVTLDPTRRTALHFVLCPDVGGRVGNSEYDFCAFAALDEVLKYPTDPRLLDIYGKSAIDYCDDKDTLKYVLSMIEKNRPEIYEECLNFFLSRENGIHL